MRLLWHMYVRWDKVSSTSHRIWLDGCTLRTNLDKVFQSLQIWVSVLQRCNFWFVYGKNKVKSQWLYIYVYIVKKFYSELYWIVFTKNDNSFEINVFIYSLKIPFPNIHTFHLKDSNPKLKIVSLFSHPRVVYMEEWNTMKVKEDWGDNVIITVVVFLRALKKIVFSQPKWGAHFSEPRCSAVSPLAWISICISRKMYLKWLMYSNWQTCSD